MLTLTMPSLSPTMEEGKLVKWLVKEGDSIAAGDLIAEIETDKATMEYEAVDEGVMGKFLVAEGQEGIKVNAPIALLLEEGEDRSKLKSFTPPPPTAPAKPKAAPSAAPSPAPSSAPVGKATPAAAARTNGRIIASPLARRLAVQRGIDLAGITGSGPNGRIIKADLEHAKPAAKAAPAATPAAAAGMQGEVTPIPHSAMRKTIARRMTEAKSTIPHFYLTVECDLDALLALRAELNKAAPMNGEGNPEYKLSVNDFIIRASALALRRVPEANASWSDAAMLRHKHADIGVAVAMEDGLITPIIRQAELKGLAEISNAINDLAARARARKLKPDEYQGGTFTISNLGMFGVKEFSAVINPPQSMILAVGAGEQRPVVRDGALAIATRMDCTLSCDHRIVDGALGARFLSVFRGFIEKPLSMLV
jgi:pyruvate dehydrogenase E2 component (dihydrolipoamide acetyltransferase)